MSMDEWWKCKELEAVAGRHVEPMWRRCAARTLGVKKRGYTDGLYDAEKVAFFGARMVAQEKGRQGESA